MSGFTLIKSVGSVSSTVLSPLVVITSGILLSGTNIEGIPARALPLSGADFPVPTGMPSVSGGQTLEVPAIPLQSGLPVGVGVARRTSSGQYIYVCNTGLIPGFFSFNIQDQPCNIECLINATPLVFDKPSGGGNYRYVVYRIDNGGS